MTPAQSSSGNAPPPATNGQPTPSSSNFPQVAPISWEGDRMFNVYIHDYFRKRGFYKAAKELVAEAEIGPDATPPINARQGFLFEWWSVFWMFFSAKTTGGGPENVMLYFHWMQNQQTRALHESEQRRNAQAPLQTQAPPQQRAMVRPPINGVRPPMVNGAVAMPQGPGQPSQPGQPMQYPMVPHGPMAPGHQQPPSGPGQPPPQMNGIVDPSAPHAMNNPQRPPSQQQTRQGPHGPLSQPQQGAHPPPSHPNTVPHLQASQRQVSRGQHDPMRAPGQFQSPTMHSAPPPGPGQQGSLAAHTHMAGMPSQQGAQQFPQHLGRGPPPQAGQPNNVSPRNPSQTPTQQYQQLMNHGGPMGHQQGPTSRSATPGGHPLTQPSPALASREPPQGQGPAINEEMSRRFQQQAHGHPPQQSQQQNQPQAQLQQQRTVANQLHEQQEILNMEASMSRIPPVFLAQMKMEAGLGEKDVSTLSYDEKARLNTVFKKTMDNYNGTTFPANMGRNGRQGAGPSQQSPMSGMPMYPQHAQPGGIRQPSGPRGQKRGSTSPDEGDASTPKDQSPPDKKRLRPSPPGAAAHTPGGGDGPSGVAPPMSSMGGFPPGHPGNHYPGPNPSQQQMPQNMPMAGMRHHGPPPGQTLPNAGGMSMNMTAGPGMGHAMPPGMAHMNLANQQIMGGHPIPNANPQAQQMQQQMHYRQSMAQQHLVKMPGMGPNPANPGNSGASPSGGGDAARPGPSGPGGPGPGSRPPQQGKPGSMMPPPSPAHRPENANANTQKGPGMMPPPAQPGSAAGNASGVPPKEQTAPSPRVTGSSPSMRPASASGAGSNNNQQGGPSAPQGSTGGPATPASAGGGNTSAGNTTAPSPSAIMASRISPTAAMNSLPRPQTSGPEVNATTPNAGQDVPPTPSSSAPPGPGAGLGNNNLFADFFDTMGEFSLESTFPTELDSVDFARWINIDPSNTT